MTGSWSTMIPSGVNAQPGIWKLTIDQGGVFLTHPQGNRFQPGDVLDVTPTELVLAPDPGCPGQGTPTEGRYQWRIDGDTLAFELVSDSCRDRADTLTSSDWSLAP